MKSLEKFKNPLIFTIIVLLAVNVVFNKYKIIWNFGDSMEPTYANRDFLIVERPRSLGKEWRPERYDVVVIKDEKTGDDLVKRVVGLAKERIEIKNGLIYIDGVVYDKFGKSVGNYSETPITVPKGHVWLIGDNKQNSWYGILPIKNIKGLVIL